MIIQQAIEHLGWIPLEISYVLLIDSRRELWTVSSADNNNQTQNSTEVCATLLLLIFYWRIVNIALNWLFSFLSLLHFGYFDILLNGVIIIPQL